MLKLLPIRKLFIVLIFNQIHYNFTHLSYFSLADNA